MKLLPAATLATLGMAVVVGLLFAVSAAAAIDVFRSYGYTLFLGLPFVGGGVSVLLYGRNRELTLMRVYEVTALTGFFTCLFLLLLGMEGFVCILMALPIVLPLAAVGGVVAHMVRRTFLTAKDMNKATAAAVLPLCVALAVEPALVPEPELRAVSTQIEIAGDALAVWEAVVAFPPIEAEPEFPFTWGIACPLSATIEGSGVGAIRRCEFSTGAFVEPITVWDPGRRLEFSVTSNPPPMTEISFFGPLDLPHLHGTFESERGRFLIETTDTGGVLLTGTTWYRQRLWPQFYWNRIADPLIHRIHLRVLRHIQSVVERQAQSADNVPQPRTHR